MYARFIATQPGHHYWVLVVQLVHSWIFATISKDLLCEVCDLIHAFDIWKRLEHRFNTASLARTLDLKRMLTNLSKGYSQSMEDYLQTIKTIADSLAAIQSPVFDLELFQYTIVELQHSLEYNGFLTAYYILRGAHSFDDLCSKLIFFEQRSKSTKDRDVPNHQAFAATISTSYSRDASATKQSHSSSKGGNDGGWNFNKGGNGCYKKNNNKNSNRESASIRFFLVYVCRFCFM